MQFFPFSYTSGLLGSNTPHHKSQVIYIKILILLVESQTLMALLADFYVG